MTGPTDSLIESGVAGWMGLTAAIVVYEVAAIVSRKLSTNGGANSSIGTLTRGVHTRDGPQKVLAMGAWGTITAHLFVEPAVKTYLTNRRNHGNT